MDVVNRIGSAATSDRDRPVKNIVIEAIKIERK
jgi:hypothetical protein